MSRITAIKEKITPVCIPEFAINSGLAAEGYLLRSLDPGNPKPSGFRKKPT